MPLEVVWELYHWEAVSVDVGWRSDRCDGPRALRKEKERRQSKNLTTLIGQYLSPEPSRKCPAASLIGGER